MKCAKCPNGPPLASKTLCASCLQKRRQNEQRYKEQFAIAKIIHQTLPNKENRPNLKLWWKSLGKERRARMLERFEQAQVEQAKPKEYVNAKAVGHQPRQLEVLWASSQGNAIRRRYQLLGIATGFGLAAIRALMTSGE